VGNHLLISQKITYDKHDYGYLNLCASTSKLDKKIGDFTATMLLLMIGLIVFAYLLALKLQSIISRPILHLARITREISKKSDYSMRAEKLGSDEIGVLYDEFNKMLDQIEARKIERDRAEEALRKSEKKYRSYIDNAPNGIFVLSGEGKFIECNDVICRYAGYSQSEMSEFSPTDLLSPKEKEAGMRHLERLFREGKSSGEVLIQRKDGTDVWFYVDVVRVSQDKFFGFASDVTRLKQTQEKLEILAARLKRSNNELQDFASVASHDLQEPLRKVRAFGDRLKTVCADSISEKGLDYLVRMQNAANRMQTLINDLLTFSRVTTKAQPHRLVKLNQVTEEVLSDLEVRIEDLNAIVKVDPLPTVVADPLQMRQLIQNLIGNALKFHKPDERPVVEMYATPSDKEDEFDGTYDMPATGFCQIVIKDNGIGFEQKYADRIFAVFQRLQGRSEYEGTGVGLAVCRKIVERHGGNIIARSKPGQGAKFIITLPTRSKKEEVKDVSNIKADYNIVG
jgi:two-component system sensor kinase FixL